MTLSKLKLAVLGALVVPMASVLAEEAPAAEAASDFSFSANVGLYSDYIFRGYTQTENNPALQGGFDVEHASGLYAGVWASNVDWTTNTGAMSQNSLEVDLYAGFAGTFGDTGIGYDVGVLQFLYPGKDEPGADLEADATELYFGVSKDFGFASAGVTYYHVISTDAWAFADAEGSEYWSLDIDVHVGDALTASFHVGDQSFDGTGNSPYDYTDWKVNVEYAINDTYALGAFYTDTDMAKSAWGTTNQGTFMGDNAAGAYLSASF